MYMVLQIAGIVRDSRGAKGTVSCRRMNTYTRLVHIQAMVIELDRRKRSQISAGETCTYYLCDGSRVRNPLSQYFPVGV